jgi:predicted nucleotidyltransferase
MESIMNCKEIIKKLQANKGQLHRFYVKSLFLFGSAARDQACESSDIDILVEFMPDAHIGIFTFVQLQRFLSDLLECRVDLVTCDALHKELKEEILKEMVHAA